MENISKLIPENLQKSLQGIYLYSYSDGGYPTCIPIVPLMEPLTIENFRLIVNDVYFTADEFMWGDETLDGGDFVFNNQELYLGEDEVPIEVFKLLATITTVKFADRCVDYIKSTLNLAKNNNAKKRLQKNLQDFNRTTDNIEKLHLAVKISDAASKIFEDIDENIADAFYDASEIVKDVLEELEESADK